jgi:hypothetical protein
MQVERDPLRDVFRESAFRENAAREPLVREPLHRELSRELGRDFAHETLDRTAGRQPLNREPGGRVIGSPLPGSPLPTGAGAAPVHDLHRAAAPPGRALSTATPPPASAPSPADDPSGIQRAMGILKQAAPFVARLLPLIDGNFTGAISNLFLARPHAPSAPVDLTPVHNQLSEMQLQHNDLRSTVQEQTTSLKRVEDQLELVREATDRNTLEQQELIEDLKAVGHKVSLVAVGFSILLVLSVVMNVVLYMYIKRLLP